MSKKAARRLEASVTSLVAHTDSGGLSECVGVK